jgi:hypothetical protein
MPVRMPPDVKRWLRQQAKMNLTSQTAEAVAAIRFKMKATEQQDHGIDAPQRLN